MFLIMIFLFAGYAMAEDVEATWQPAEGADGYRIYYGTSQDSLIYSVDAGQQTTFIIIGLECGTQYFFEVRAYNETGETVGTNRVNYTTQACFTLPEIPEGWEIDSLVLTPTQ